MWDFVVLHEWTAIEAFIVKSQKSHSVGVKMHNWVGILCKITWMISYSVIGIFAPIADFCSLHENSQNPTQLL